MFMTPYRRIGGLSLLALLTAAVAVGARPAARSTRPDPTKPSAPAHSSHPVGPLLLSYPFQVGQTRHYQVTALFDGHVPPFSQPGSQPIHILAKFGYLARVVKQDAQGAQVEFTVDSWDMSLLTHEIELDGKVSADDETPFQLITLPDVQKALNTTALLRPDGSVANIINSGPNMVRLDIGFDLRKLFLLVMPVIFRQSPVRAGDTWTQETGLLGSRAGSISYANRLVSALADSRGQTLKIEQTGLSKIEDTLDKEGHSTEKPDEAVSKMSGTVTIKGDMNYTTSQTPGRPAALNARAARMVKGQFTMLVSLMRTVTKADLAPEVRQTLEGPIDVKARMLVRNDEQAALR